MSHLIGSDVLSSLTTVPAQTPIASPAGSLDAAIYEVLGHGGGGHHHHHHGGWGGGWGGPWWGNSVDILPYDVELVDVVEEPAAPAPSEAMLKELLAKITKLEAAGGAK